MGTGQAGEELVAGAGQRGAEDAVPGQAGDAGVGGDDLPVGCTCRGAGRCAGSWRRACGPGGRCASRGARRAGGAGEAAGHGERQRAAGRGGADRAVPGHWEGDLIEGKGGRSPGRHPGGALDPVHDAGPAAGGKERPGGRRRADPGDRGPAGRAAPVADLGPGQGDGRAQADRGRRGLRRSTSPTRTRPGSGAATRTPTGLLRQYFPKGTELSSDSPSGCGRSPTSSTGQQRKTLGWKTPAEALAEFLDSQAA